MHRLFSGQRKQGRAKVLYARRLRVKGNGPLSGNGGPGCISKSVGAKCCGISSTRRWLRGSSALNSRPQFPAIPLVCRAHVPRFEISHRLFAARCVSAIIDRGRLLRCGYRPEPRLCPGCLRVAHDATDYWSVGVTESHIIIGVVCDTAFACRYEN